MLLIVATGLITIETTKIFWDRKTSYPVSFFREFDARVRVRVPNRSITSTSTSTSTNPSSTSTSTSTAKFVLEYEYFEYFAHLSAVEKNFFLITKKGCLK
jgi:hypothetical protein